MLRIRLLQAMNGLHSEPTVASATQSSWGDYLDKAIIASVTESTGTLSGTRRRRLISEEKSTCPSAKPASTAASSTTSGSGALENEYLLCVRCRADAGIGHQTANKVKYGTSMHREPSETGRGQKLKQKRKQTKTGQRASRLSRALCQFSASSRPIPLNAGLQRPPMPLDIPKHLHCLSFQGNSKTS